MARRISESTIRRLSLYLHSLEELEGEGVETVSSEDLAGRGGTTAAQVRKDLSLFGSFGKRGLGYDVAELRKELQEILGVDRRWRVALVGAGRIGAALFEYGDFRRWGFEIVTVLDADPDKVGRHWGDVEIRHADELEAAIRDVDAEMLILAVPAGVAQEILDRAVEVGVRGVLNFAPTQLQAPPGVSLQDVNMVMELEALSFALTNNGEAP